MYIVLIAIAAVILIFFGFCYGAYWYTFRRVKARQAAPCDVPGSEYKETIVKNILALMDTPFEAVTIKSHDNLKLFGRYYHFKDGAPIAILFHGYRSTPFRDGSGGFRVCRDYGLNVLLCDQRAHGKSEGKTITFGVKERLDCMEWIKYLKERFGNDIKLLLVGLSMGAATVMMASDIVPAENVKGIVADCGFSSPKEILTDVAKQMGADIIIGVDIQNDLFKADELKSITEVFTQIVGLMGNERYKKNVDLADIYIKPNVDGFSTFSFNTTAIDSLISNGYLAASEKRGELEKVAAMLKGNGNGFEKIVPPSATEIVKDTFNIASIQVNGLNASAAAWILRKGGLKENSIITGDDLNKAISIFYGTNAFSSVTYKISKDPITNADKLVLDFVKGPANLFALGVRFDSEEAAAILLHLGIHTQELFGSRLALTGRLSYNAYGKVDYSYVFRNLPRINVSYMFKSTDMNIYERGELSDYMRYYTNRAEVFISNVYLRNFDFTTGVRFESYKYRRFISSSDVADIERDADLYLSYFITGKMDIRDNKSFPTRGVAIDAEASFFQPEFNKENNFFATVKFNASGAVPISNSWTLLPAVYYRSFIGNEPYTPYINFAGGSEYGRYISQQIPFIGINYAEMFDPNIMVGRVDLRKRIGKKHYLYGIVNYMRTGESFEYMFNRLGEGYWGAGIKYTYNTPLGPIGMNVHWSDYNEKVGLYLNIGYYF